MPPTKHKARPRGRPFTKGDLRINRDGRPKDIAEEVTPEVNDAGITEQLLAIRAAARLKIGKKPKDPTVALYAELKRSDPKAFTLQWERLERQDRADRTAREESARKALTSVPQTETYDRYADEMTPEMEMKLEAWLSETLARVEAMPP